MKPTSLLLLSGLMATLAPVYALAGPPFQTDDPAPVPYHFYEFYTFGNLDATPLETDTSGPAVEFNWGAVPNVQLHIILPAAAVFPSGGPNTFGLGDIETGIKYRFVQETKYWPMIGTFTMFEVPSGNPVRGLGVGKPWTRLPVWVQKSFGPWTTYGGVGETIVAAPGYRNYTFGGWLVQRDLSKKLTLGTEVYAHGPEGIATPQTRSSTMVDAGGYYNFNKGFSFLFAYGHSVGGETENYAYVGLYWTWGAKGTKSPVGRLLPI